MIHIDYGDHTEDHHADQNMIERTIKETLHATVSERVLSEKTITVDVALVTPADIQQVNARYRGKDRVTDIISVGDYDQRGALEAAPHHEVFLGELVLCYEVVQKSAILHNVSEEYELVFIVSHGVLHLLGYVHGSKMFDLQREMCKKIVNTG